MENVIKTHYKSIILCILVIFSIVFIASRGDYGIHHNDSPRMERLQNGLDRADDRISDAETELEHVDAELELATGTSREVTHEMQQLRNVTGQNHYIIKQCEDLIGRSEERNQRV